MVGINTLTTKNAQAIGYAIAIDTAKLIIAQLRTHGRWALWVRADPAAFMRP